VNPETKKKRNEREKARFLILLVTSNKATLAPRGSPNDGKSLAATCFKRISSVSPAVKRSVQVSPLVLFKGTERLLSKN
jgi:hypothetical protein